MGTLTEMIDATTDIRRACTGSDWPLISICSGTDNFYDRLKIISRSEYFGNQSEVVGVDASMMEITTHWNTEG